MSTVDAARLRSIAKTIRQLPSNYTDGPVAAQYFNRVSEGAKLIREAERLGAFQGDSIYVEIGKKLAHPSCLDDHIGSTPAGDMPVWRLPVWYAVVDTLAPELSRKRSLSIVRDAQRNRSMRFDTSSEEAEIVARAIEAEADRLEGRLTPPPVHIVLHPCPKGNRPKRLDGDPTKCQPWIDYEDAIFHFVDGFNVVPSKCWDNLENQKALKAVGCRKYNDFYQLHRRTKKRLLDAVKK